MTTSTYDFCGLSKSPQHAKPPHLRARLPSVVVSSRGPLELDCCPEAKPQSQHSSNQHNEVRQGGTRSLPAVVPPREMMELELGEFTCTQIKEAISALKMTMFKHGTCSVLPDTYVPHGAPLLPRRHTHTQGNQRRPSAPPCTLTRHAPSPSKVTTRAKHTRKSHPSQATPLPHLAPYALGAVELHRAHPLSRTTTLHGRCLTS